MQIHPAQAEGLQGDVEKQKETLALQGDVEKQRATSAQDTATSASRGVGRTESRKTRQHGALHDETDMDESLNEKTTMLQDIRHNISNLSIGIPYSALIVFLMAFVSNYIILPLRRRYPEAGFATLWLPSLFTFMLWFVMLHFAYLKTSEWKKRRIVLGIAIILYIPMIFLLMMWDLFVNQPLRYYSVLLTIIGVSFSFCFFFLKTFRKTKLSKIRVLSMAIIYAIVAVSTSLLSQAYIGLSYSNYIKDPYIQLFVFGISYPLIGLATLRIFLLRTLATILKAGHGKLADGFQTAVYVIFKLFLSLPAYYVLLNIENNTMFIVSIVCNLLIEVSTAFSECVLDSKESAVMFFNSMRNKIRPSSQSSGSYNRNHLSLAAKHLQMKQQKSKILAYEEFTESICVLLCFIMYDQNRHSVRTTGSAEISIDMLILRILAMYVLVFVGDLIQKRIFNRFGYYLSRHEISFTSVGFVVFVLAGVVSSLFIPCGSVMSEQFLHRAMFQNATATTKHRQVPP